WIVDATGRAAMLARKLGHFRQNDEHPINAVWARFSARRIGIVTTGASVFQITRRRVARPAHGRRTISWDTAGGAGSFRCAAAMSVLESFTITAFSNFPKDRTWANACTRTFSAIQLGGRFSATRGS